MPQLFHPRLNILVRVCLVALVVLLAGAAAVGYFAVRSPLVTGVGIAKTQPVAYSHAQHVGELGLDCRYCHSGVEESNLANLPSTETCMGCHVEVAADSPDLALVRDSFENDTPLAWVRVHNLIDTVYFNHAIHVRQGVGCETCHGRVDQMPVIAKTVSLQMDWCLDCHRAPEKYIRPREEIVTMGWQPPVPQDELGRQLVTDYGIEVEQLTDCSICHR